MHRSVAARGGGWREGGGRQEEKQMGNLILASVGDRSNDKIRKAKVRCKRLQPLQHFQKLKLNIRSAEFQPSRMWLTLDRYFLVQERTCILVPPRLATNIIHKASRKLLSFRYPVTRPFKAGGEARTILVKTKSGY